MDMNPSISHLSLGVAIVGLSLLIYWMRHRLETDLSKLRTSLAEAGRGCQRVSLLITTLRCLPLGCIFATLGWLQWFNWRESALAWFTAFWLLGVMLTLAVWFLEQRLPAAAALEPELQPCFVTAENCAEFGLTPEEAREAITGLMDAARQAQSAAEAEQPGAAADGEVSHQN